MRAALFALVLLVAGCDTASDRLGADVTLRDFDGAVVATGTLSFDGPLGAAGDDVGGAYRLDSPGATGKNQGALRAVCEPNATSTSTLRIVLDPEVADGGTYLTGGCGNGLGGGAWASGSIAGPVPAGTFELD